MGFTQYRRSQIAELRMYEPGEDMTNISVSAPDTEAGSPKLGDMIARNPKNHNDKWLVAAQYFRDNFEPLISEPLHGHKETSSRVSSIAANILNMGEQATTIPNHDLFNALLRDAKSLAGSCMSRDETPGQEPIDFLGRLKHEREQLNSRLEKLTNFLATGYPRKASPIQMELLEAQRIHMSEYLAVLDARLADMGIIERSAPVGSDGA